MDTKDHAHKGAILAKGILEALRITNEARRFSNDLQFDKIEFIERCLSASYSLKETDSDYKNYISEIEALFEKYSVNAILTMPNETTAYIGQV